MQSRELFVFRRLRTLQHSASPVPAVLLHLPNDRRRHEQHQPLQLLFGRFGWPTAASLWFFHGAILVAAKTLATGYFHCNNKCTMSTTTDQAQLDRIGHQLWHELRRPFRCYEGLVPYWDNESEVARIRRKEARQTQYVSVVCERCSGTGGIANWSRVYGSKCFACGGSGRRAVAKKG